MAGFIDSTTGEQFVITGLPRPDSRAVFAVVEGSGYQRAVVKWHRTLNAAIKEARRWKAPAHVEILELNGKFRTVPRGEREDW